jgi:hypothetical protein
MARISWLLDGTGRRLFADEGAVQDAFNTHRKSDDLFRFLINEMGLVLLIEANQRIEVCFANNAVSSIALRTARDRIATVRPRAVDIRLGYGGAPTTYVCSAALRIIDELAKSAGQSDSIRK